MRLSLRRNEGERRSWKKMSDAEIVEFTMKLVEEEDIVEREELRKQILEHMVFCIGESCLAG